MSEFIVPVIEVEKVLPHPNADRLEVIPVKGFFVITRKGQFRIGDLAAYIPEGSVVPQNILEELGMKGSSMLGGKEHNRIKAVRLRGEMSQGLLYPARNDWQKDMDVSDILGITKYVAPIPSSLAGEVRNVGKEYTVEYDIENIKKFPDALRENEQVVMTEKIHGTWSMFGLTDKGFIVSSKGLAAKGLAFKNNEANKNNLYLRVAKQFKIEEKLKRLGSEMYYTLFGSFIFILGESFGVQDLKYGADPSRDDKLGFRVFDICFYTPTTKKRWFADYSMLKNYCDLIGLPIVPELYQGSFSKEKLFEVSKGIETVSGKNLHIREGVVVKPVKERYDFTLPHGGRVQLKSINPAYLFRKNKNATEFE